METPLIIECPVIGAELTREMYPYLPLTPDEISSSAADAVKAGASVIHLHVRDENGEPSQRLDIFEEVTEKIRNKCDCIIQYSTGGAVGIPVEERIAPLKLKPDMATLTMGTIDFGEYGIFENEDLTIETIINAIEANGVVPELEIFGCSMVDTAFKFLKHKKIPENFNVGLGFGLKGGMSADPQNIISLARKFHNHVWIASGISKNHLPISAQAIAIGGHVRVGIEDNIYFRKGEYAKSNAQLVSRIARISKELERPVATVGEARKMLKICK